MLRFWAAVPLTMEVVWAVFVHYSAPYGVGSVGRLFQLYESALMAIGIGVLSSLPSRRWRLFGSGAYVTHALMVMVVSVSRVLLMYSNYAIQSGWIWFVYNLLLATGYSLGMWMAWKLCRNELALAETVNTVHPLAATGRHVAGAVGQSADPVAVRLEGVRRRLWALSAPLFMLVVQPTILFLFEPAFWSVIIGCLWGAELAILLFLILGQFSDRPMRQVLSAGGCGFFATLLGSQLFEHALLGDTQLYDQVLAPFAGPHSLEMLPQVLFYLVLVVVVVQGLRATAKLVMLQLLRVEESRGNLVQESMDDELEGNSAWDEGAKK